MTFVLYLAVVGAAFGIIIIAYGVFQLIRESREINARGSDLPKHTVKIPIIGFELNSDRLSLTLIAFGVILLWVSLPTASSLLENKEQMNPEAVADGRRELEKLLPTSNRPRWHVSFSSCLILPEEHERISHFLQGLSFSSVATRSHPRARRNDRLADTDTVFYYTSTNMKIAETLVRMLNAELGRQFVAARGDGIGVPAAKMQTMLVVHRIGEDCRKGN